MEIKGCPVIYNPTYSKGCRFKPGEFVTCDIRYNKPHIHKIVYCYKPIGAEMPLYKLKGIAPLVREDQVNELGEN